jgi:hypothetical protein
VVYICIATAVTADIATDVAVNVTSRTELEAWVKIQQPEELEVFDALRLSIEVLMEILAAEVLVELASETELAQMKLVRTEPVAQVEIRQLEVRVEIQQLEELEVLLIAVRC